MSTEIIERLPKELQTSFYRDNPKKIFVLSIISCGFYDLLWFYRHWRHFKRRAVGLNEINQQNLDNYLIEQDNYQQDYQQGVTAAKKDWADSRRFYGILPPSKKSLLLKEKDQILVTDFQAPVSGFRNGYRKEMAKLKLKQNVKRTTTCCLLWVYFIGVEGFTEIFP